MSPHAARQIHQGWNHKTWNKEGCKLEAVLLLQQIQISSFIKLLLQRHCKQNDIYIVIIYIVLMPYAI